jgi:hypothetical protein
MSIFAKKIKPGEPEIDEEEKRMLSVLAHASKSGSRTTNPQGSHTRPIDAPRPTIGYLTPKGNLFYCFKTLWRDNLDEGTPVEMLELTHSVPDCWENVRYRLEQKVGLHNSTTGNRPTAFLCARQIIDFENGELDNAHQLSDIDILDEHSVIVLYRQPSNNGIGHYVPLDMLEVWRTWFDAANAAQKKARHGRRMFGAKESDFHTCTHSHGKGDRWFRRQLLHASNYGDVPPAHWHCPRCQVAGDHWENTCIAPEEELRVSIKRRRMIHGIPRSRLRQVDPESSEGRMSLRHDGEGNVYVERTVAHDENWMSKMGMGMGILPGNVQTVQEDEEALTALWVTGEIAARKREADNSCH